MSVPTIASAGTITLPSASQNRDYVYKVSGTTTINTISGGQPGTCITLIPTGAFVLGGAGNISATTSTASVGTAVRLIYDGSSWREQGSGAAAAASNWHSVFNDPMKPQYRWQKNTYDANPEIVGAFAGLTLVNVVGVVHAVVNGRAWGEYTNASGGTIAGWYTGGTGALYPGTSFACATTYCTYSDITGTKLYFGAVAGTLTTGVNDDTDMMFFYCNINAGQTTWQAYTATSPASNREVTDTGVTVTPDTEYRMEIIHDVNDGTVDYYINGTRVATHTLYLYGSFQYVQGGVYNIGGGTRGHRQDVVAVTRW